MATTDISGAYLHTASYEEVMMIFKGIMVELLLNIYPNIYIKNVVLEKGVKVIYVKLQNNIYDLP